jgi:hypothetical protein
MKLIKKMILTAQIEMVQIFIWQKINLIQLKSEKPLKIKKRIKKKLSNKFKIR